MTHFVDIGYYKVKGRIPTGWTGKAPKVIAGCTPNGPECDHCCAAAEELEPPRRKRTIGPGRTLAVYDGTTAQPRWTGEVRVGPREQWAELLDGKGPELIHLASNSDLFHNSVSDSVLLFAFRLMHLAYWNIWQICTTRALRMSRFMSRLFERDGMLQLSSIPLPTKYQVSLPNVWMGVSAGTQQTAAHRIPHLLKVKTSVKFVWMQPLLERVDVSPYIDGLDWIIAGGEFDRDARYRPMHLDWARAVRDLCVARQVPFFFTHRACTVRNDSMSYLDNALWRQLPRRELAPAPGKQELRTLRRWVHAAVVPGLAPVRVDDPATYSAHDTAFRRPGIRPALRGMRDARDHHAPARARADHGVLVLPTVKRRIGTDS